MNSRVANDAAVKNAPRVVELAGPAGAGKTTLLRALSQRNSKIRSDLAVSRVGQLPFYISNTFSLLPTYLRQYRHSRWFSRRETRSMAYLKAWLGVLGQQASSNGAVTVLDQGPIYRLAFLRALGPELTTSQPYKRWWTSLLSQWAAVLDVVIWLDAPNAILLERIRNRESWHTIKEKCDQEAHEYLDHYRTFLERTIAESVADHQIALLRFDTNQESVEQIVGEILITLDAVRQP
jgi:shikimate kinase